MEADPTFPWCSMKLVREYERYMATYSCSRCKKSTTWRACSRHVARRQLASFAKGHALCQKRA
jgi:hypothetical protein